MPKLYDLSALYSYDDEHRSDNFKGRKYVHSISENVFGRGFHDDTSNVGIPSYGNESAIIFPISNIFTKGLSIFVGEAFKGTIFSVSDI